MSVVAQSLSPDDLTGVPVFFPVASRHEVLSRRAKLGFFLTGDFRGSLAALEDGATRCEREGRIHSAAIYLVGLARCRLALGEIAAADEAYAHAIPLRDRLPASSDAAGVSLGYAFERCIAVDDGWAELLSMMVNFARQLNAETLYTLAAAQAGAALILARLGRADAALPMLATIPAALDRAPAWAPNYTQIACSTAATLWCVERIDHAECIERNLRDKVIEPDFRYPMVDSRLALAQLCALQRRYDEAVEWFAKARVVLDEQGARPLRAIVDYDEALTYVRRGKPGDAKRAAPLLEAALAQFRDIGMPGWIRCAEYLLREGKEWRPEGSPADQPPSFDSAQDRRWVAARCQVRRPVMSRKLAE